MRTYELMFIVRPELEDEALDALVERVQQVMTDNGGQAEKVDRMGRRRLAYPIKKHRDGHYVLIQAGLERLAMTELERNLKLSDDVIRHLLVRLDED